jgi:hypothetical protein
MRIETTSDNRNQPGDRAMSKASPYETRQQAAADAADVYDRARRTPRRGAIAEANLARLTGACEHAQVIRGAYDTHILEWLADWESETCTVIAALVTRAYAAGRSATGATGPLLDPYCQAGQHANCPGRLCQCPHCQHRMERQ